MKKIKLILKGALLYATIIFIMLFIMMLESIVEQDASMHFIIFTLISIVLVYTCKKCISKKEFELLTFTKYFN